MPPQAGVQGSWKLCSVHGAQLGNPSSSSKLCFLHEGLLRSLLWSSKLCSLQGTQP